MAQTLEPVPPVVARRRALLVFAFALLVVAVLTTTVGLLGPSSDVAITLIMVAWLITQFAPFLSYAFRPVLDGTDLTAWTVSGRRTIDMRQLARVDRLWFPGRPRELDMLVLRDTNRIRLTVNRAEVDDAVFASITDPECAEPRVAAGAGHRLGLIKLGIGYRFLRGVGAVLLAMLYSGLTLVAIIAVAVVIEMSVTDQWSGLRDLSSAASTGAFALSDEIRHPGPAAVSGRRGAHRALSPGAGPRRQHSRRGDPVDRGLQPGCPERTFDEEVRSEYPHGSAALTWRRTPLRFLGNPGLDMAQRHAAPGVALRGSIRTARRRG